MIPARYAASRFPGKLMKDLGGKPVIVRTYEATIATALFDEVFVVTDSDIIYDEIEKHGGKVIKSKREHNSGSDRIAEAITNMNIDIVVNVQGDEPFTNKEVLKTLLQLFQADDAHKIDVASLATKIDDPQEITNPNTVKVVMDQNKYALYFSRYPIPYPREESDQASYYKHIGIYAFRKKALLDFYTLPMRPLEIAEKIECLRYLEYGKTIKMGITTHNSVGIDIPEDLIKANQILKRKP